MWRGLGGWNGFWCKGKKPKVKVWKVPQKKPIQVLCDIYWMWLHGVVEGREVGGQRLFRFLLQLLSSRPALSSIQTPANPASLLWFSIFSLTLFFLKSLQWEGSSSKSGRLPPTHQLSPSPPPSHLPLLQCYPGVHPPNNNQYITNKLQIITKISFRQWVSGIPIGEKIKDTFPEL